MTQAVMCSGCGQQTAASRELWQFARTHLQRGNLTLSGEQVGFCERLLLLHAGHSSALQSSRAHCTRGEGLQSEGPRCVPVHAGSRNSQHATAPRRARRGQPRRLQFHGAASDAAGTTPALPPWLALGRPASGQAACAGPPEMKACAHTRRVLATARTSKRMSAPRDGAALTCACIAAAIGSIAGTCTLHHIRCSKMSHARPERVCAQPPPPATCRHCT